MLELMVDVLELEDSLEPEGDVVVDLVDVSSLSLDSYSGVPSAWTVIVGIEEPFQPGGGLMDPGGYIPGPKSSWIPQTSHPVPQKS